jgi:membrane protease YdiL (CAAX protease family)
VNNPAPNRRSLAFFVLLLALAIPIWLLSRFVGVIGSLNVPVTDLMLAFAPLTAAAILTYREKGAPGAISLVKRAFDFRGVAHTLWIFPVVLLAPLIHILTYATLHLAGHGGAAEPQLLRLPFLAGIIFLLAVGEEGGWMGYVIDPLQDRWGALGAGLIVAVPWWLGHLPSIIEIGGTAADIAWWIPGAIGLRILIVWLYNNTGRCLFSAVVFHTLLNVGRLVLYPTIGSHYDTTYQATGYTIAIIMAAIVVLIWGAKTLTR